MTKCKHKWVDMEDGTLDKFCIRCRDFAKQQMAMPMQNPLTVQLTQPMGRETMEVPFYNDSEHIRIKVDKENFLKEIRREQGLEITHNVMQSSMKNSR